MGFLDRLLGRDDTSAAQATPPRGAQPSADEVAVERYRYLLRTAPAATIEQAHREAFATLTPEQRAMVYRQLADEAPPGEQPISDAPNALARAATRSELRAPGSVERAFSPANNTGGPSFGQMFGASMLGTIAGFVVGTAIADAFFPHSMSDQAASGEQADASGDGATDASADAGAGDAGGFGDFGDFGGDFGF